MAQQIDQKKAVGHLYTPQPVAYNRRDLMLYALGVGADELKFTYELDPEFSALPFYPVVLSLKGASSDVVPFGVPKKNKSEEAGSGAVGGGIPGIPKYDPNMILHGEQSIELLRPLPLEGKFTLNGKLIGVWDKGKGALLENEHSLVDEKGNVIAKLLSGTFVRGLGGFGGEKQPKQPSYDPPNRPADKVEEYKTSPQQAMLYRLSGDYNPLHADPNVATKVGFPKPILHGLCTFGISSRAILKSFANNDTSRFQSIKLRFSSPVFPGETIVTEMWKEGDLVIFQAKVKERNVVVLSGGCARILPAKPISKL